MSHCGCCTRPAEDLLSIAPCIEVSQATRGLVCTSYARLTENQVNLPIYRLGCHYLCTCLQYKHHGPTTPSAIGLPEAKIESLVSILTFDHNSPMILQRWTVCVYISPYHIIRRQRPASNTTQQITVYLPLLNH